MCRTDNISTIDTKDKVNNGFYARVGNVVHTAHIINILTFAFCVVKFSNSQDLSSAKTWNFFDPVWEKDGFCVSNPTTFYWNSHDLCLYADTVLALVLGFIYFAIKDTPGMKSANNLVKWNILGILGHGLAHGGMGWNIRKSLLEGGVSEFQQQVLVLSDFASMAVIIENLPALLFWLPLIKATMPNGKNLVVLIISLLSIVGGKLTPVRMGFTYTQTVLFLCFSLNQLMQRKSDKTFAYTLYAALVTFPLGLVGWQESMACTNFVIKYGGHLIYDAYIPISSIIFYLLCYGKAVSENPMVKKLA